MWRICGFQITVNKKRVWLITFVPAIEFLHSLENMGEWRSYMLPETSVDHVITVQLTILRLAGSNSIHKHWTTEHNNMNKVNPWLRYESSIWHDAAITRNHFYVKAVRIFNVHKQAYELGGSGNEMVDTKFDASISTSNPSLIILLASSYCIFSTRVRNSHRGKWIYIIRMTESHTAI